MTVIVTEGKSREFLEMTHKRASKPLLYSDSHKNILEKASIGVVKFSEGTVVDWHDPLDEFLYILKGTLRVESEGKTHIAKEGDSVLITRMSKAKMASEGVEALYVMFPKLDYEDLVNWD